MDLNLSVPSLALQKNAYVADYRILDGAFVVSHFSRLYRAQHRRVKNFAVVKQSTSAREEDHERFVHEAMILESLNRSHVQGIPYYYHSLIPHSNAELGYCIILGWIDGINLYEYMMKYPQMGLLEKLGIVQQILEILKTVHSENVIHRDLKPGNIIIGNDGKAFLVDFGLARLINGSQRKDAFVGTPGYIAPEHFRNFGTQTAHTDIYSVGRLLANMLVPGAALMNPVTTPEEFIAEANRQRSAVENSDLIEEVRDVILKATVLKQNSRYASASEMIDALPI